MKSPSLLVLASASLLPLTGQAQVTVHSTSLGYGPGFSRAYLTHASATWPVSGLIQPAGGPQVWDFSNGPADDVYRQQVVAPAETGVADAFPDAELAERSAFDSKGQPSWAFYRLAVSGRELHGFHDVAANASYPQVVLDPPVVDFPAVMHYGDTWSSSSGYPSAVSVSGLGEFTTSVTVLTQAEADAWGTLTLPGLGAVNVLRVNELTTLSSVADVGGFPVDLGDVYVRSYFWISCELGIVAQIASEPGTAVPGERFAVASRFLRLSEREAHVQNLRMASAAGAVTLTWDATPGANAYQVFHSADLGAGSWSVLSTVGGPGFSEAVTAERRFYMVRPVMTCP